MVYIECEYESLLKYLYYSTEFSTGFFFYIFLFIYLSSKYDLTILSDPK